MEGVDEEERGLERKRLGGGGGGGRVRKLEEALD